MLNYRLYDEDFNIGLWMDEYTTNGNTAVIMLCKDEEGYVEPFADLTVNIIDLPKDEAAIDTNDLTGITEWIEQNKIGAPTGRYITSGFCSYPIYKLNLENIKKNIMEV